MCSESLLADSIIYSFFAYGSTKYLYLALISLVDGSVSVRYKSTISCSFLYGSGANGDYIIASANINHLVIYNRVTTSFIIKMFSGSPLYGLTVEPTTGR